MSFWVFKLYTQKNIVLLSRSEHSNPPHCPFRPHADWHTRRHFGNNVQRYRIDRWFKNRCGPSTFNNFPGARLLSLSEINCLTPVCSSCAGIRPWVLHTCFLSPCSTFASLHRLTLRVALFLLLQTCIFRPPSASSVPRAVFCLAMSHHASDESESSAFTEIPQRTGRGRGPGRRLWPHLHTHPRRRVPAIEMGAESGTGTLSPYANFGTKRRSPVAECERSAEKKREPWDTAMGWVFGWLLFAAKRKRKATAARTPTDL